MDTANDLLDKVKAACNFPSDNVLAQKIGLTRAMVSSWRHGRHPIPDERIAQMCALAKLDGPTWIAMLHAERAQTATERALWRLMLDRLSAAAAVVALVALSMPGLANAKTAQIQAVSAADNGGMYIMFNSLLPDPCFACHGPGPILTPSLIVTDRWRSTVLLAVLSPARRRRPTSAGMAANHEDFQVTGQAGFASAPRSCSRRDYVPAWQDSLRRFGAEARGHRP
ncbi:DUF3693 domain-containing protein [Stenotrophomonas maltophilia]|uniref:DUF3693 domain-containing protein n=1 Tax=Stenotrophomonas maltophilia TaxID=40324 RepID=A0AAJ2TPA9_STEMA|nr:DUF3693 domain-containing protein [Stenotrophomonas maltophilia]MDZ5765367.1 DUF3693 domain-containing protein [Stenotrophomonas maltophilia]